MNKWYFDHDKNLKDIDFEIFAEDSEYGIAIHKLENE